MKLTNIGVGVPNFVVQFIIIFSDSRTASFFEFLIIIIIMYHPDRDADLPKILEKDFNIKTTNLIFEHTFKELVRNKIIHYDVTTQLVSKNKGFLTQLKYLRIIKDIDNSFKTGTYIISTEERKKTIKLAYMFLANDWNFEKKEDKLTNGFKNKIIFHLPNFKVDFVKKQTIQNLVIEYLNNNLGNSTNFILKDIETVTDKLTNPNPNFDVRQLGAFVNYYERIDLEISPSNKIELLTQNELLKKFLMKNVELKNSFLKSTLGEYSRQLEEFLAPKRGSVNDHNFSKESYSFDEIEINRNTELILINNNDVLSTNNLFDMLNLANSLKYVIIYNNRNNLKKFEIIKNKYYIYIDSLYDEVLNNATINFLANWNDLTSFSLTRIDLKEIDLSIPVFKKVEVKKRVDFNSDLADLNKSLQNNLTIALNKKNYVMWLALYNLLKKIDSAFSIKPLMVDFVEKSFLNKTNDYSELRLFIYENGSAELLKILNNIIVENAINLATSTKNEEFIDYLFFIDVFSKEEIEKISQKSTISLSWAQTFKLCSKLQENNLHPWDRNYFNCMNQMFLEFDSKQSLGMFGALAKQSDSIFSTMKTFSDNFASIIRYLITNNILLAEDLFIPFNEDLFILFNKSEKFLAHTKEFLINLWSLCSQYYQKYEIYINSKLKDEQSESNYEIKLKGLQILNKIKAKLASLVEENFVLYNPEFLYELLKLNPAKNENTIKNINKENLKFLLNVVYGKLDNLDSKKISKLMKILED